MSGLAGAVSAAMHRGCRRSIRARCSSCKEMTPVTYESKQCPICGGAYIGDVPRLLLRQREADECLSSYVQRALLLWFVSICIEMILLVSTLPLWMGSGNRILAWWEVLIIFIIVYWPLTFPAFLSFAMILAEKKFPELYQNPDWNPDQ